MSWTTPGPAGIALGDYIGQLLFFCVGGYEPMVATQYGDNAAVRCTVVVLTGPDAGGEYVDNLIFNSRIVQRLRGVVGTAVLGGVVLGEGKGKNQPYDIVDPGPQGQAIAQSWAQANPGRLEQLLADVVEAHRANQQRAQQPAQRQSQQQQPQQWQSSPTPAAAQSTWQAQPQQPTQQQRQAGNGNTTANQSWSPSQSAVPGVEPATQEQAGF